MKLHDLSSCESLLVLLSISFLVRYSGKMLIVHQRTSFAEKIPRTHSGNLELFIDELSVEGTLFF